LFNVNAQYVNNSAGFFGKDNASVPYFIEFSVAEEEVD
jgi:hypothetical protein